MIDVEIKGLEKLTEAFARIPKIVDKEVKDGLTKAAFIVERTAKHLTPVDTGRLRASIGGGEYRVKGGRSSYVKGTGVSIKRRKAIIGTNLPYAERIHKHGPRKGGAGEAEYLKKAVDRNASKIKKIFQQTINSIIKKLKSLC